MKKKEFIITLICVFDVLFELYYARLFDLNLKRSYNISLFDDASRYKVFFILDKILGDSIHLSNKLLHFFYHPTAQNGLQSEKNVI